jgi:hypothetical protein
MTRSVFRGQAGTEAAAGAGITLAPDLTLPSRLDGANTTETAVIDPSGALTTALSLTGKHAVYILALRGLPTGEAATIKLTIDGIVIINDPATPSNANKALYGAPAGGIALAPFIVETSLLLEIETVTDTSVNVDWAARKIT